MHLLFMLIVIFFSYSNSRELVLTCFINKELENNIKANMKIYEDDRLNIFFDKETKWINDFSFNDWKKQKDNYFDIKFINSSDAFLFKLKRFHNKEKKNLESVSKISINKKTKYLEFKKYYYNFNQEIFFTSEVRGNCK